ncbi:hypothetical protein OPV22_019211 [Ensete ventricosum]|uniref:Uncharacterized protein n=1 Tax=Ensete ventricosum TaxID=4639 RepID=A0AAV8PK55_ENSVE|nr:hypothetical protein OPV22_019211 [Ensete ventricosum]RWW27750.1 hypothetical protein GW17_00007805 [Ensete ventricosum]RWW73929.1 hypothetical protein BHE74_00018153 [Ensete ventricosum]RZR81910.1 hypothetical protein BHM03_00008217 [Ensete ventricosum]
MRRYTDGRDWYDCTEYEGLLLTVTADEEMAMVEVHSTDIFTTDRKGVVVEVTILETDSYYEESTGTWEHFFDVQFHDTPVVLKASVSGRKIKCVVRWN